MPVQLRNRTANSRLTLSGRLTSGFADKRSTRYTLEL